MSLEFLIAAFVVVLVRGTGVIYTVATGLGQGRTASFFAALGCTFGIVPHMAAAALGFAPNAERQTNGRVARTGFFINILNPKLSVFFLAFLP